LGCHVSCLPYRSAHRLKGGNYAAGLFYRFTLYFTGRRTFFLCPQALEGQKKRKILLWRKLLLLLGLLCLQ